MSCNCCPLRDISCYLPPHSDQSYSLFQLKKKQQKKASNPQIIPFLSKATALVLKCQLLPFSVFIGLLSPSGWLALSLTPFHIVVVLSVLVWKSYCTVGSYCFWSGFWVPLWLFQFTAVHQLNFTEPAQTKLVYFLFFSVCWKCLVWLSCRLVIHMQSEDLSCSTSCDFSQILF